MKQDEWASHCGERQVACPDCGTCLGGIAAKMAHTYGHFCDPGVYSGEYIRYECDCGFSGWIAHSITRATILDTPSPLSINEFADSEPEVFVWQSILVPLMNKHPRVKVYPQFYIPTSESNGFFLDFASIHYSATRIMNGICLEIDGRTHRDSRPYDTRRDAFLRQMGFVITRWEVIGRENGIWRFKIHEDLRRIAIKQRLTNSPARAISG